MSKIKRYYASGIGPNENGHPVVHTYEHKDGDVCLWTDVEKLIENCESKELYKKIYHELKAKIEMLESQFEIERKPMRKVKVYKNRNKDVDYIGIFHQWGVDFNIDGQYTVAVIEKPDGHCALEQLEFIRFLPEDQEEK